MNPFGIESLESRTLFTASGTHDLLYTEIRFSDQSSYPESTSKANSIADGAVKLIEEYSGGNINFTSTVKTITLSHNLKYYTDKGSDAIANDTDAALTKAGVSLSKFEHVSYRYSGVPNVHPGLGQVGGKRTWIRSTSSIVLAHELGHNLGLEHSHFADPKGSDPFGAATISEYGDPFSNMGSGGTKDWDAYQKYALGWLGGSRTNTIDASKKGSTALDISTHDNVSSYSSSKVYLVRITIGSGDALYLSYDSGTGGIMVHLAPSSTPRGGSLIDANPSTSSANDAALKFGKSITDHRGSGSGDDIKISVVQDGSRALVTVKVG